MTVFRPSERTTVMKILINLRTESLGDQLTSCSLTAKLENIRLTNWILEIINNEYAGAAYLVYSILYDHHLGFTPSTNFTGYGGISSDQFVPRLMMEEDKENNFDTTPRAYDLFDDPPEEEDEYEPYEPEREEDR